MKNLLAFIFIMLSGIGFTQITIQNTLTPSEIVQDVLLGTGVTVSNIQWNGSTAGIGTVQANLGTFAGAPGIGINSGVILSCGNVAEAVGPNNNSGSSDNSGVVDYTTDPDLISLQPPGTDIHDAGVLEFDFVPTGDSISFNYVFASEEYPEYAPPNSSSYNDAFGFFLSGPNPAGGSYTSQNIAVLPGTSTYVSINNINPTTNVSFYVDNDSGANLQYDGHTKVIQAYAAVVCNQTYHIKLGISDGGDKVLNSAVFLQANSFSSNAVQVSIIAQTGDTTVIEGCANAEVFFIRPPNDVGDSLVVHFDLTGTAINGVDYTTIIDSVVFIPGQDSVSLVISPLLDALTESAESITITAYTINSCGDTLVSIGTIWIIDQGASVELGDATFACLSNGNFWLVPQPTSGFGPYTYLWSNGSTADSISVPLTSAGNLSYSVTITDQCGKTGTDSATITINTFEVANFSASPETGQTPLVVTYSYTGLTSGIVSYSWEFGNGLSDVNSNPIDVTSEFIKDGNYVTILTVTNSSGCIDTASKIILVYNYPELTFPNVFSPNNDKTNEYFELINYSNIAQFNCKVFDRWGMLMYEMNTVLDKWNGKNKSGNMATDGVYFYTYSAQSETGQSIEGQGFFHLIND